jgi:phosphinothricin acetyltransferase
MAGRGLGRALLTRLLALCEAAGCRQIVAVIGDSANAASIGLHRACGFREVGTLRAVGFKHGRWVDTVLMQRPLGPGDATLPG